MSLKVFGRHDSICAFFPTKIIFIFSLLYVFLWQPNKEKYSSTKSYNLSDCIPYGFIVLICCNKHSKFHKMSHSYQTPNKKIDKKKVFCLQEGKLKVPIKYK